MKGDEPIKVSYLSGEELEIPVQRVYRYLGLGKTQPDATLVSLIDSSIAQFKSAARYRATSRLMAIKETGDGIDFGAFVAPGKSLLKHLKGCDRAILFAATVGGEADLQRKRAGVISPTHALVLDAVGTAAIETYCDSLSARWREEFKGFSLRPRFSPGYGDLSLTVQTPLLALLDANRKVGITLTKALLMLPQKSVSAIIGIGKSGCTVKELDCEFCNKPDCEFRL